MKRSHVIGLLVADTRNHILDAYAQRGDSYLIDAYLTSGFPGYDNMTDEELADELSTLPDGEYDGWDDEENEHIHYIHNGDTWTNTKEVRA
jgi:hypothetical protein